MTYQQILNLILVGGRILIVLSLIGFTAFMSGKGLHIWAIVGFAMAVVASLAPVKGFTPNA